METAKINTCPRCAKEMLCRPDDISACDCTKIRLSKEEYDYISSHFQECACNACLKELQKEYAMKISNTPLVIITKVVGALLFFTSLLSTHVNAQSYAPPVGQAGTSAIYKDSSVFVSWATACSVVRGYQDLSNTSLGYATVGDNSMATGKAQANAVVSLGDGGTATCTFDKRVKNGPGYDFAVFENGFDDVFLELAFVEVSSDGSNFFRFHAHSLTDTTVQTGSFGYTDATKINNLAGKYRGGYGTPFDLQELAGTTGLDIDNITHIRIVDVVGSIDKNYASRDFFNNKVNDPWPTAFPSGGFDLDAVGVIHQQTITGIEERTGMSAIKIYPNPVEKDAEIHIDFLPGVYTAELTDLSGKVLYQTTGNTLSTQGLASGIYSLKIISSAGVVVHKVVVN